MSLFGRLVAERRDTSYQTIWGADLDNEASPLNTTAVTRDRALGLSAVFACVRLLADTVSTLPLHEHARDGDRRITVEPQPDWIDRPIPRDPSVTKAVHLGQVVSSLMLDGNAFTLVAPDVFRPAELRVLDPRLVEIRRGPDSTPVYAVRDRQTGQVTEWDWTNIIHIPLLRLPGELRGISPLEAERLMFGSAIEAEALAGRFLRSGTWLSAVLRLPANAAPLTEKQADDLIAKIERKWGGTRNSGRVGLLTGGAELQQLSVTPEQAQFLETRQYDDERIFRVFRCPPALVGMTKEGSVSYASAVMQADAFEKHTIRPLLDMIERAYGVLVAPGNYLRFNTAALLRADLLTRVNAYHAALGDKWRTVDEVRALEDLDPFGGTDGGLLQTPNNNAPGAPAPEPPPADRAMPPEPPTPVVIHNHAPEVRAPDVSVTVHGGATAEDIARDQETRRVALVQEEAMNQTVADAILAQSRALQGLADELRTREPVAPPVINVAPEVRVEPATVTLPAPTVMVNVPDTINIASMPERVHVVERDRLNRVERTIEADR